MTRISREVRPWYREPWPWIIMAPPAAAVVAGMVMLWLAITSYDGLISDDYYRQGLAINKTLRRDDRAFELNYRARMQLSEDSSRVRVFFEAGQNAPLPTALQLRLSHPTRSGRDQTALLHAFAPGRYEAELVPPEGGRWRATIEDINGTWRLAQIWNLPQDRAIEFEPRSRSAKQ